ncbi:MAG: BolA/IbaG family iron-sulfur metabolism protein [Hyphomicrobium sp.]
MPMTAEEITKKIKDKIPDAQVHLTDLAGDNDHWSAHVTSAAFHGLTKVRQHQLVYDAFNGQMGDVLHALQLTTSVPNTK